VAGLTLSNFVQLDTVDWSELHEQALCGSHGDSCTACVFGVGILLWLCARVNI